MTTNNPAWDETTAEHAPIPRPREFTDFVTDDFDFERAKRMDERMCSEVCLTLIELDSLQRIAADERFKDAHGLSAYREYIVPIIELLETEGLAAVHAKIQADQQALREPAKYLGSGPDVELQVYKLSQIAAYAY
jgi:hypothetical protein